MSSPGFGHPFNEGETCPICEKPIYDDIGISMGGGYCDGTCRNPPVIDSPRAKPAPEPWAASITSALEVFAAERKANEEMRDAALLEAARAHDEGRLDDESAIRTALTARGEGEGPRDLYAVITRVHFDRGALIVNDERSVTRWRERPDQNACDYCGSGVGSECLNGGRALPGKPQ